MGDKTLIYLQKLEQLFVEAETHLMRVSIAFDALSQHYTVPLCLGEFESLLADPAAVAFADQIIYRFSKAQDTIGAKLFKAFLLYQGENVDKPFLDILNQLEKLKIVNVDQWFELREIRNGIAHDYDSNQTLALNIINGIYEHKAQLGLIVMNLRQLSHSPQGDHKGDNT